MVEDARLLILWLARPWLTRARRRARVAEQAAGLTSPHRRRAKLTWERAASDLWHTWPRDTPMSIHALSSQRSLHNAAIFRLLLKVGVNGTHQCDYSNLRGNLGSRLALPSWAFVAAQCYCTSTPTTTNAVHGLSIPHRIPSLHFVNLPG